MKRCWYLVCVAWKTVLASFVNRIADTCWTNDRFTALARKTGAAEGQELRKVPTCRAIFTVAGRGNSAGWMHNEPSGIASLFYPAPMVTLQKWQALAMLDFNGRV